MPSRSRRSRRPLTMSWSRDPVEEVRSRPRRGRRPGGRPPGRGDRGVHDHRRGRRPGRRCLRAGGRRTGPCFRPDRQRPGSAVPGRHLVHAAALAPPPAAGFRSGRGRPPVPPSSRRSAIRTTGSPGPRVPEPSSAGPDRETPAGAEPAAAGSQPEATAVRADNASVSTGGPAEPSVETGSMRVLEKRTPRPDGSALATVTRLPVATQTESTCRRSICSRSSTPRPRRRPDRDPGRLAPARARHTPVPPHRPGRSPGFRGGHRRGPRGARSARGDPR